MKKQHKIVIGGYYGCGSLGDDAMLFSILSGISKRLPKSRVTVLCKDRYSLPLVPGIKTVFKSRTNPFSIIGAMASSDLYICGGGSLLQDSTSKRSLFYYCALLHLAKLFGCKIFLYANGIGPIKNTKRCRDALLLCDHISVRDTDSLNICRELLLGKTTPVLSADPIFAHPFSKIRSLPPSEVQKSGKPYFAVSLRNVKSKDRPDIEKLSQIFSKLSKEGMLPVYVPMQDCYDLEISQRVANATGGIVMRVKDPDELYCLLEKASFAIGMRLHFLLTAAIAGTPTVALSYDPKIESCISSLGITAIISAFDFSKEELWGLITNARSSFSKSDTEAACRRMRSLAANDCDAVLSLLEISAETADGEKFFADT